MTLDPKHKYQTPVVIPDPDKLFFVPVGEFKLQLPETDENKCTKCGLCWLYCPCQARFEETNRYETHLEWCKGCGICAKECPSYAIEMVVVKRKG